MLLIATLLAWRVRAAMLIGILATTALGMLGGLVAMGIRQHYALADLSATALQLDVRSTLRIGFMEIVFVFLFIDLFDNIGTLVAVGKKAGLFDHANRIPRVNRILFSDAAATIVGSLVGHLHRGQLYRKRRRRGRGRTHRSHRHRHRPAVFRGAVRRAGGGRDPCGGHRAGADHRGQPHDVGGRAKSTGTIRKSPSRLS